MTLTTSLKKIAMIVGIVGNFLHGLACVFYLRLAQIYERHHPGCPLGTSIHSDEVRRAFRPSKLEERPSTRTELVVAGIEGQCSFTFASALIQHPGIAENIRQREMGE